MAASHSLALALAAVLLLQLLQHAAAAGGSSAAAAAAAAVSAAVDVRGLQSSPAQGGPAPAAGGVALSGFVLPISVSWDLTGNIYILEKAGRVKLSTSWVGVPQTVILDISRAVASYGDHGATSLLWDGGFLYITYSKVNPVWGPACADYGQFDGRPLADIKGCTLFGRLSRWRVSVAGAVTGQEEVLFDTESPLPGAAPGTHSACVQFSTHSTPVCVIKRASDGAFFISLGDGAAFTTCDTGTLGGNPCHDEAPFTGAFRSQHPERLNGKIVMLDPVSFKTTIMSLGHRNPFRLSLVDNEVANSETVCTPRPRAPLGRPRRRPRPRPRPMPRPRPR